MTDTVSHPPHYTAHPSGVEAIEICEQLGFNAGNALKYLWRADLKHESPLVDLRKALFYVQRELACQTDEYIHIENLPEPIRTDFLDGSDFFKPVFKKNHVFVLISRVLEFESRTWVAGAMAYLVRGYEQCEPADLAVSAHYIQRCIDEVSK